MVFALRAIVVGLAMLPLFASAAQVAHAGEPSTPTTTPSATQTAIATPAFASLVIQLDGTRVFWTAASGAEDYRLIGEFFAVEINATNPCLPTQDGTNDRRTITVDETLPGVQTSFDLPLPALPPEDEWAVSANFMELTALDAQGAVVGGARGLRVLETCQIAAPSPVAQLPSTGAGSATDQNVGEQYAWVIALVFSAALLLAAAVRRVRE